MTSRRLKMFLATCFLAVLCTVPAFGGEKYTQKIAFDNTRGIPGKLQINSGSGDISITGYSGKEVIIEAETDGKISLQPENNGKAKGLKRIAGSGFNVMYDKDNNTIIITRPLEGNTRLDLKVPRNMELKIGGEGHDAFFRGAPRYPGGVMAGNITISNIDGNMEINTLEGDIIVKEASGVVIANAAGGDIEVTFTGNPHNKPMAFSTIEGDVDVTLPENIKATIRANNADGDVYTDFDIEVVPGAMNNYDNDRDLMMGMFGNAVTGKINGGGSEIKMTTVDGQVYIRKGK